MALFSSLFGKNNDYSTEYKRYKKSLTRNPSDHILRAQFIKFCLLNRFTKHETMETHISDALRLFATIENSDSFDLQCHYLVGKYYQEGKDNRKAYQVYLNGIRRFNQFVGKNPELRSDNAELAYSISLNLMNLQSNPVDPQVEICFKHIRKSYPLHLKSIELENEMAKPAPDPARIKQLAEEVRKLRAEEEKDAPPPEKEKKAESPASKPAEKEDIFTKLFRVPPLQVEKTSEQKPFLMSDEWEKKDSLKLAPATDSADKGSSFMVFRNNDWEGPFTLAQLRSMGRLDSATWVCRVGSQLVTQAYEAPDLHSLIK
jgi:hypothetical protein